MDALEVVGGVLLEVRVPGDLLGEHDLAVDEGGGLAVAAAEVEADAAAVEVALLACSVENTSPCWARLMTLSP